VRLSLLLALSLAFASCGQTSSHSEPAGERRARPRPASERSTALPAPQPSPGGGLVYEETSEYSHFKIYDRGSTRYLMFVRDNGHEVVESALELNDPDRLTIEYTQVMFASHLFRPEQERVLIIGLGGGSMVRFLRRFFPEVAVTAVEIDPSIARVAASYFGVVPGPNVNIAVEDGFDFVARDGEDYDVVYMDAFLKPGTTTDDEGAPLNMQTLDFLRDIQGRLLPGGLLVININVQDDTPQDIATLREAFPHVYLFEGGGNLIAVASTDRALVSNETMAANGRRLDRRGHDYGFSFEEMVERITEE
jgi:spermidine synthase